MIVVHRTGNPSASARSNNRWAYRTGAASWHYIIDDNGDVIEFVPPTHVAWHAKKPDYAEARGRVVTSPHSTTKRGDYDTIGIEVVETPEGWSPGARASLLKLIQHLQAKYPTIDEVVGHSELDPTDRPDDPDGLWSPANIRAALAAKLPEASEDERLRYAIADKLEEIVELLRGG